MTTYDPTQVTRTRNVAKLRPTASSWEHVELTDFPEHLGSLLKSWEYVMGMFRKFSWLEKIFPVKDDYLVNLRAYRILLSALDLACMTTEREFQFSELQPPRVHPVFLLDDERDKNIAFYKVFPDGESVNLLASTVGANAETLRQSWPQWMASLHEYMRNDGNFLLAYQRPWAPSLR